jgi:hypothetical protein
MPPKKNPAEGDQTKLLAGFEDKETKLIAAAFLSSIGPDKVSILSPGCTSSCGSSVLESQSSDLRRYPLETSVRFRKLTALQYDYDLMATLTGNTNGSLKKMWPPIKKKAIEAHASFATFLGTPGTNTGTTVSGERKAAGPPQAKAGRKRKGDAGVEDEADENPQPAGVESDSVEGKSGGKPDVKKKAAATKGKGRPPKKAKKDVKSEEDSADGGDGMGQYTRTESVMTWLSNTDGGTDAAKEIEEEV